MSKELYVSSTPHETKVAVVEEDQLAEIYYERENEYTLAGSIYKGRVTRVLPGMQSAFVNVGLERDAFLYVTDFLLEDDEDADGLEQVVARSRVEVFPSAETDELRKPIEAGEIIPSVDAASLKNTSDEDTPEAATGENAGGQEQEREGARKWRGRRRRGRGRDRFPDRGPNDRGERERPAEAAPEDRPEGRPEARSEQHRPESTFKAEPTFRSESAPRHEPARPEPILLPGESISKYQPHSASSPVATQTPSRAPSMPRPRPSTEYSIEPSQFTSGSMVLPGESLAKYGQQSHTVPAAAAVGPVEAEYQERGFLQDVESTGPIPRQIEKPMERRIETEEAPAPADHHAVAVPVVSSVEETLPAPPAEEARRFESMNVASVFGGSVAEPSGEVAGRIDDVEEQIEEMADSEQEVESAAPSASVDEVSGQEKQPWVASGAGVMEEEEIEDEESDIPGFEEDHDLADFDELEEEVLGPSGDQMVPMGRELTEAVRDAHVNEQATGQYEAEGLEAQDELDESGEIFGLEEEDLDAGEEGEEGAHDPEDLEGASAEQRAPGTAGYQQRTDRRPQDRRGGRRGPARRMRGRPRQHTQRQMPVISDLLKEGQEILVQIAKEPIAKKGARITSHIALPGRYVVYMPTVHHTGVSRKIATEEERHRLKRIAMSERGEAPGGFIVRTAAAGAEEQDLRADIRFLVNLWNEIRGRAETSKAPALIYHDLNLVERILRDQVSTNFSAIWADTEQEYERILRFVSRFQPSLVKRVKLYSKDTPLFEQFNITDEINKALKSKVWLRSGGYIVINQTEALVAIDINTGKYVGKTARLEDTIVKTNIDAIKEIVRQIRLRDLGGIIVIDFIDMDERRNRQKVMQALEEALKADRAPSKVLQFNDFGLVAITRKRVKQSLERTLGQPCPTCAATGMIKSVTTVCNEIYVEMRKMARHFERDVMVRVNPEVAKALKGNNGRWLQEMEELVKRTVLVKSDALLHP